MQGGTGTQFQYIYNNVNDRKSALDSILQCAAAVRIGTSWEERRQIVSNATVFTFDTVPAGKVQAEPPLPGLKSH